MVRDDAVGSVFRALRQVNLQGSIFGQTVAIRFGLSESDIDTLEALLDGGAATAGRLAELLGLSSGAMTRVVDRLERAGYVRRVPDPGDRRKVIVEPIPERAAEIESMFATLEAAAAAEADRYTPDQLEAISGFLARMAEATGVEAARLRTAPEDGASLPGPAEHGAVRGGLERASLLFRSGAQELRLRGLRSETELYRARFEGATPQVRLRDGRVIVAYRGTPFDWRKRTATMTLSEALPWEIDVVGGIRRLEADLRAVDVRRLELTGGSERVQLELGRPAGQVPVRVTGGSKSVRLERPASVPVSVLIRGGVGHIEIDGRSIGARAGEISIGPDRGASSSDGYRLEVIGGSKSIDVVARPD